MKKRAFAVLLAGVLAYAVRLQPDGGRRQRTGVLNRRFHDDYNCDHYRNDDDHNSYDHHDCAGNHDHDYDHYHAGAG